MIAPITTTIAIGRRSFGSPGSRLLTASVDLLVGGGQAREHVRGGTALARRELVEQRAAAGEHARAALVERLAALDGQRDADRAPVVGRALARDQAAPLQAVDHP